jgi:hypothetical protein
LDWNLVWCMCAPNTSTIASSIASTLLVHPSPVEYSLLTFLLACTELVAPSKEQLLSIHELPATAVMSLDLSLTAKWSGKSMYINMSPLCAPLIDVQGEATHMIKTLNMLSPLKIPGESVLKKATYCCSCYRSHTPKHKTSIDPSDFCDDQSIFQNCLTHINVNHILPSCQWHITVAIWTHIHNAILAPRAVAPQPPAPDQ